MDQNSLDKAAATFRQVLAMLPLVQVTSGTQAKRARALVHTCKEYIVACRLASARKEEKNDVRQTELAALLTHCKLQPLHELMCLYMAIGRAWTIKNLQTAGHFCRRFLELARSQTLPATMKAMPEKVCVKVFVAISLQINSLVSFR